MNTNAPLAIVAGAGPGLGRALVQRFQKGGYHSVGLSRTGQNDGSGDTNLIQCDLTDPEAVATVAKRLMASCGAPKVVVHNPAKLVISPFEKTSAEDFETTWRSMVLSAVLVANQFLPAMAAGDGGSFLVSGATASLRGAKNFSAFASAKAGLRGLTQSLAREYSTGGIHVAHVILDGILDTPANRSLHDLDPARMMDTNDVAEAYWQLAYQPQSTWTHELDLRPMGETF